MANKHEHLWGYDAHNGPHTWSKTCENASGAQQSPINIETKKAVFEPSLLANPLKLRATSSKATSLLNTGHCFQVRISNCDAEINGGPLTKKYKFAQFHMHWGRENAWGSEHTINGLPGAAELHLVFWNYEKYSSFEEAVKHSDGLAVLGMLVKEGELNTELEPLFRHFSTIKHAGQQVENLAPFNIEKLLPANKSDYYTYAGSLTTPPCNECVTWIVFKDPITLSSKQLDMCRSLHCTKPDENQAIQIEENYRTTCPIGKRVIRKSFK